jgi:hypothetical protein
VRPSIPRSELEPILRAIGELVAQHGHPEKIPLKSLLACGISREAGEKCQELILNEDLPADPAAATDQLLRRIGESTE